MQSTPGTTVHPSPRARARRGGFTLLEILVVIGIILLLVAIGVIGFQALDQSGKVTKTTLHNLKSMLTEYEERTKLREQPAKIWFNEVLVDVDPTRNPPIDLWQNPVVIDTNGANVSGAKRLDWGAVGNTQMVISYLTRIPENKQLMTKLPSKQLMGKADVAKGTPPKVAPTGDETLIDPPLVLDAWNNPIVFVGRDGLAGVRFESRNDNKDYRVTSAGIVEGGGLVGPNNRSKSWRPFFASAGPDGDFRTGDDNVYSFEQ